MLSTLLPRHTARQTPPSSSPAQRQHHEKMYQEIVPLDNDDNIEHEVLIENQVSNTEGNDIVLTTAAIPHHPPGTASPQDYPPHGGEKQEVLLHPSCSGWWPTIP